MVFTGSFKKNMNMKTDKDELAFVAKHYQEGRLDEKKAWKRFASQTGLARKRVGAVAAACIAACIALACITAGYMHSRKPATRTPAATETTDSVTPGRKTKGTKVFRYENAPLRKVLDELSAYYHTRLTANDTTRRVTGEIETTSPEEVIEILEKTLDVEITAR